MENILEEIKTDLGENSPEVELNNQEENDTLSFKLENFEGPLDLLLHLIKQSKMEIETVELSKITEQYLDIMNKIIRSIKYVRGLITQSL